MADRLSRWQVDTQRALLHVAGTVAGKKIVPAAVSSNLDYSFCDKGFSRGQADGCATVGSKEFHSLQAAGVGPGAHFLGIGGQGCLLCL